MKLTAPQEEALRKIGRSHHNNLGAAGEALVRRGLATRERVCPTRPGFARSPDPPYTRYALTTEGRALLDDLLRADRERLEAERVALGVVVVPAWALREVLPSPENKREAWTALREALALAEPKP